MGNIGPDLRAVGPPANFAFFDAFDQSLVVPLILLGRLEIYATAAVLTRAFWKS